MGCKKKLRTKRENKEFYYGMKKIFSNFVKKFANFSKNDIENQNLHTAKVE